MIKAKNLGELIISVPNLAGNQATGAKYTFVVPFPCQLKAVHAAVRTAGTTGTDSTDIQKNGTSIFSGGTRVDIATGVTTITYGALSANPTTFAKGDIVTINVISVHTTPAVDKAITLVFQRLRGTGPVGAMLTGTIGPEAEV